MCLISPGLSLVLHVGDETGVSVGHCVGHDLGAAVGKDHAPATVGGVTVTLDILLLGRVSRS